MSNDTYPDKPGCYIAGNHGHYAVAELCSRYGASRSEQHVGNCYLADPDDVSHELLVDIADKIEARWNESLPDHLVAGWWDGEFCVIPNEEGVIL